MADESSFDEEAFLREHCPDLFSCGDKELLEKMKKTMSDLQSQLKAMQIRKIDPVWWDPATVIDAIDWINEDYGWEGVGR